MPQDATCPKCKHIFPVTQARHPVGVRCPGCDAELTVEFHKRPSPVEPGVSPYEISVKQGKPAAASEAAIPPTPKRPRRDDEEDEEEEKSTGKGSSIVVLLAGLTALFFAVGGLGATGYFLFTNLDTSDSTINTISTPNNFGQNGNRPAGNPGVNPGNPGSNPGGIPGFQNQPPPKITFEYAPVSGPVPTIKPPTLNSDAYTLLFPTKAGAVTIGGGGRYIVMHFPQSGQLGIFDASTAQMTLTTTDTGDVKLAAGLSRIVTLVPNANTMRVFSITEPKAADQVLKIAKLFDSPVPVNGIGAIAMGSRTNGPVIGVGTFGDIHVLDIAADSVKEIEEGRSRDNVKVNWGGNCLLRATPDGMAFITCDNLDKGRQTKLAHVENKQWKSRDYKLVPFTGADGLLYGNGIVTNLKGEDQRYGGVGLGSDDWFVPAACGNTGAFLKVAQTGGRNGKKTITVTIHNKGNANVPAEGTPTLSGLPEIEGLWNPFGQASKERPFDRHLFLFPEAKLLAILSTNMDKLLLRKIDLK